MHTADYTPDGQTMGGFVVIGDQCILSPPIASGRTRGERRQEAADGVDRRGARRDRRLPPRVRPREEPESTRRYAPGRRARHAVPRGQGPAVPDDRAPAHHAQHRGRVRHRPAGAPPGAQRSHGRVPGRRRGRGLDAGPVGRGDRRRQDLRPRRRRHEGRHLRVDLHLLLPASRARAPRGQAHPHRGVRRGDVRAVGRTLPDGAPSRGPRRLLPERRAQQPADHPLR